MATSRPFSFNTGSSIAGTQQLGQLAIGTPTAGFSETGLKWWNGPDEDLGYVIAMPNPSGQMGADGTIAYLGFWRSDAKTEASFLQLAPLILGQTFPSGDQFKTMLNNIGLWTSWGLESEGGGGQTGSGIYTLSTNYAPAPQDGTITFPAHPLVGGGPGFGAVNPNLVGTSDATNSYQIYINPYDSNGNSQASTLNLLIGNSGTLTLTQGQNQVVYSFTNQAFKNDSYNVGPGGLAPYFYDSQFPSPSGLSPVGSLTVLTPSAVDFNTVDPIQLQITTN